MSLAPIALFVYNRPQHTLKTLTSLMENDFATDSDLFIYCDGPKISKSKPGNNIDEIKEVRNIVRKEQWCKNVTIIESEHNRGLAKSIIHGVSEIVEKYKKVIVLEDDMVSSKYFLKFMNESLELYENDEKVISITGYLFPVIRKMPETFFLRGTYCWGWATWKRGWDLFSDDSKKLLNEIRENKLSREFDFYDTHHYTRMLEEQAQGKSDSWALPWYAAAFLKNKLTLLPGKSLIQNIGLDNTGTHGDATSEWNVVLANEPVSVNRILIAENKKDRKAIAEFFKSIRPKKYYHRKVISKFRKLIRKVTGFSK